MIPQTLVGNVLIICLTLFSQPDAPRSIPNVLGTNDCHFAVVDTTAQEAQQSHKAGPFRPFILAPKEGLNVTSQGGHFIVSVENITTTGNTPGLFVKPMLVNSNDNQLQHVTFNQAFLPIRSGSASAMQFSVVLPGMGGNQNAERG